MLYQAIAQNKDILQPWFPWAQESAITPENTDMFIRKHIADWALKKSFLFLGFTKDTKKFTLATDLSPIDTKIKRYNLGFWQDKHSHGHGYITESANALTRFAFDILEASSVILTADENNLKSRAVSKRLNYNFEGILHAHQACPQGNGLRNTAHSVCLNKDTLPPLEYKVAFSSGV